MVQPSLLKERQVFRSTRTANTFFPGIKREVRKVQEVREVRKGTGKRREGGVKIISRQPPGEVTRKKGFVKRSSV